MNPTELRLALRSIMIQNNQLVLTDEKEIIDELYKRHSINDLYIKHTEITKAITDILNTSGGL